MLTLSQVPFEKLRHGDLCLSYLKHWGRIVALPQDGDIKVVIIHWSDGSGGHYQHQNTNNMSWVGHVDETP